MNAMHMPNLVLWGVQVFLALFFLAAGGPKLIGRADERLEALETALWAGIAAVIAIARWDLVASRFNVSAWLLVAALGLLVPAAIVNVVVLVNRPVRRRTPAPVSGTRFMRVGVLASRGE